MQDDVSDIQRFYDKSTEHEHDRLIRHQLEFDMTLAILQQYLPTEATMLEVGAATGRYTVELLRRGHKLTVVDLSPAMIAASSNFVSEAGFEQNAELHVGDARHLDRFGDAQFDAVLLMGPLYHLVHESDRVRALAEAHRLLRGGGLIFTAHISRFGILGDLMANVPDWIEARDEVRTVLDRGRDPEDWPEGGFRGYFTDVVEITPFHEELGFETIELAAVEPAISADDEAYNRLGGEQRQLWLTLMLEVRNNPTTIGASRHILYAGRKRP